MYCKFYGLSEKPFNVTPDPKFLYQSPCHREALAALAYGIQERSGFIAMVGEVGVGKTTLLNAVLERCDEKTKIASIFYTDVPVEEMLSMVLVDLGLAKPGEPVRRSDAVQRLHEFSIQQLASGGNVVLVVDEAQNLAPEALENLRLLSNLETHKRKLIQVVLSGQPELNAKLNRPELRQLAQRISIRRDIKPLSRDETERYIQYRLQMADYEGRSLFSRAARKLIWKYSQGVPRKINVVCGNALISGYALRKKTIGAAIIAETIRDLHGQSSTKSSTLQNGLRSWHVRGGRRVAIQFASVSAGILALTAGVLLASGWQRDAGLFRAAGAVYPLIQHPDRVSNLAAHQERPVRPAESTVAERPAVDTPKAPVAATLSRDLQYDAVSFLGGPHELLASGQTEFRIQSVSLPRVAPAPRYQDAEGEGPAHAEQRLCDIECIRSSLRRARAHEEQRPIDEAPIGERVGPADQQAGENPPPARKVEDQSNNRQVRSVIVKASDILSKIIMETYGRYDPDLLRAVLEENPEIRNPDRIAVGQAIRLPIL